MITFSLVDDLDGVRAKYQSHVTWNTIVGNSYLIEFGQGMLDLTGNGSRFLALPDEAYL